MNNMGTLTFERTARTHAETLLAMQKESFYYEYLLYQDDETSPYKQTLQSLKEDIQKKHHYTILYDKEIIGAFEIKEKAASHHLTLLFIAPQWQDKGLGKKVMQMIVETFTKDKSWTLYTPFKSVRNHHFYESLGFVKYGEAQLSEQLILYKYRLDI